MGEFILIEKTISLISEALKNYISNQSKAELLVLIREYAKLKLYKEAVEYVEEFLEKDGDIIDLIEISESFPEEIKDFLKGIKDSVEFDEDFDADSFLEMGELLWEIGSPNEARDNYLKAFKSYNAEGDREQAEEVLNTILNKYPDDEEVEKLELKDTKAELLAKLNGLKDVVPQDEVDIRYALGKKLHEEDLLLSAEENYKRILDLKSEHKARRYLVSLLTDKNELEEALKYAEKLQENDKLDAYYSLSEVFRKKGDISKADLLLKEIYEINKEYKDVKKIIEAPREEKEDFVKEEVTWMEKDKEVIKPEVKSTIDEVEKGKIRIVFL
jgi:hypothetical protein